MSKFDDLIDIVKRLRDKQNGCPWDLKQTSKSLVPNFIEELYEAVEAIENEDYEHLTEELGDLLLHIVMQARIAEENGKFDISEVTDKICNKLIKRHPHIFDSEFQKKLSANQVKYNWERIKINEKKSDRRSLLDGIPKSMPALIYAQRMQEKAASVGFDWTSPEQVIPKIKEEIEELEEACLKQSKTDITEEIGDMIFSLVNLSRKLDIDTESALKNSAKKFYKRFSYIEEYHRENNENIYDSSLEKLDDLWEKSKNNS